MSEIETLQNGEIILPVPADQNPALVYLATLRPSGRRTMKEALNLIAGLAGGDNFTLFNFAWHTLRYQHTAAIRQVLAEKYRPATVNKILSALRQTLKEAWQLGQMSTDEGKKKAVKLLKISVDKK
jgi:hypothetical protein